MAASTRPRIRRCLLMYDHLEQWLLSIDGNLQTLAMLTYVVYKFRSISETQPQLLTIPSVFTAYTNAAFLTLHLLIGWLRTRNDKDLEEKRAKVFNKSAMIKAAVSALIFFASHICWSICFKVTKPNAVCLSDSGFVFAIDQILYFRHI